MGAQRDNKEIGIKIIPLLILLALIGTRDYISPKDKDIKMLQSLAIITVNSEKRRKMDKFHSKLYTQS